MTPLVIPIFIAHQGCPHRCIFCDQFTISGSAGSGGLSPSRLEVSRIIELWLDRPGRQRKSGVQVAFYGGSFTGLHRRRQEELLDAVQPYIREGRVDSVRISTRPDYIDPAVLSLLREYSVNIVELGIQSLDQEVLELSRRGHTAQQAEEAISLLRQKGFTVGAQVMCGLPGDTTAKAMQTAEKVAALTPDFVRIYPALVLRESGLESMFRRGTYRPLSLFRAVALCSRMKIVFDRHRIRVVRMGLQPSRELEEKVVAGPYHPAFGELVLSRHLFKQARKVLRRREPEQKLRLGIAAADESAFRGRNNGSMKKLAGLGLLNGVELVFDRKQQRGQLQTVTLSS
ncbi:MAG: radical SAM protein [Deltaproteobacteria bacterium]|jgi:histone acetyltransferase (RNA polymerase elongator complex component)|nr:radical SAM protein [Deltaproteobacteria bacterium]